MMRKREPGLKGFTLVELLVVISIIAMLLSVLMPALGRARKFAQVAVCGAQLHQIGTVFMLYAQDDSDMELPPSFASGNWNAFYDFTRDKLDKYNVKNGKIFYCPAYRKDPGNTDPWNTGFETGYGRKIYYIGYQLFTNAIRADIDPLRMLPPWPLANGIDKALPFSNTPTLSWHYSFVHADPQLQHIVPIRKLTDNTVMVRIYGVTYAKKVQPAGIPMVFDQVFSRDDVFNVYSTDTVHVDNGGRCLGLNAVFADGHTEWRSGRNMKVLRDYGIYGGAHLKKWF